MYAFQRMKDAGAFVTTSESMLLALVGGASHPRFKQVQKIIMTSAPDTGLLTTVKGETAVWSPPPVYTRTHPRKQWSANKCPIMAVVQTQNMSVIMFALKLLWIEHIEHLYIEWLLWIKSDTIC